MPAFTELSRDYIKELRYLKDNEGKISVMYKIIAQKKEMPKLEWFYMAQNKCRGKNARGTMSIAFRTLKLLKVIRDNHSKMEKSKVQFIREYSIRKINYFLRKENLSYKAKGK